MAQIQQWGQQTNPTPVNRGGVEYGTPGQPPKQVTDNPSAVAGINLQAVGGAPGLGNLIAGQATSKNALTAGMSGQDPNDINANNAVRDALMSRLSQLGGNSDARKSELDTQLQRGEQQSLDMLRRNAGGGGGYGNSNYGADVSGIAGQIASQRAQGLQGINEQELSDLGSLEQGLQGVNSENLGERTFQFNQGNSLANLINGQTNSNIAYDQNQFNNGIAKQGADNALIGSLIGAAGNAGGMWLGKKST